MKHSDKPALITAWIREYCELDADGRETVSRLYEAFKVDRELPDWPRAGAVSLNMFSMILGCTKGVERRRGRESYFVGIRLRDNDAVSITTDTI
jgi:hypothetical protein